MDHLIEHIRYGVFSSVVFRAHPVHIFHGCAPEPTQNSSLGIQHLGIFILSVFLPLLCPLSTSALGEEEG